ncbi:MAG: methyltransferase domain-containing protein [Acidobacteriota bacterium]
MRRSLLDHLQCPASHQPLDVAAVHSRFSLDGDEHIVDGVLASTDGAFRYPVLDEIPRLLAPSWWNDDERAVLERTVDTRTVEPEMVDPAMLEAEIRRRAVARWTIDGELSDDRRARAHSEGDYIVAEMYGDNKRKYVDILTPHIDSVDSLLELGGNFPGLTRVLSERFKPRRAVVANLAITYPEAFKSPRRDIACVRADAQALPFRDGDFELVVTAFMLEHVPDWRRAMDHILRVGERAFVAFGPNAAFPFEVGHVNAPLAGSLPAPLDRWVAWPFLAATGKRRSLRSIKAILDHVYHVSAWRFRGRAKRLGAAPHNLFPALVERIIADKEAPLTGPRRVLKRFPALGRLTARLLATTGLEPQMYYLLRGHTGLLRGRTG